MINYRLIEERGEYYLVSNEVIRTGDISISDKKDFRVYEVINDPIDGFEFNWNRLISGCITESAANGGCHEKLISSTKPFNGHQTLDLDKDLIKIGTSYFIMSDKEPRDRDLCVTFDKNTTEPSISLYYKDDDLYYIHKPKSIVCSTNTPGNNFLLDKASLLSSLRDRKINKILR